MKNKKNRKLQTVDEYEDPTDRIVKELIEELNSEDYQEKQVVPKKKKWYRGVIFVVIVALLGVGVYLLINLQTYTQTRISETYSISSASDSNYQQFGTGIIKYSRDGMSYLNQSGEEKWNYSYQIKTPMTEMGDTSSAIYDLGGNDIIVFQKDGVIGEVETTMPIERVAVSKQGIVAAVLKNGTSSMVMCYDVTGNVLVEHKTSLSGTGYPLDVALSEDGETMQVLYLFTQKGKITSKVAYYNFGEAGEDQTDHKVLETEYDNTIMASGFYMNQSISAVVGDNCLAIYRGTDSPKEVAKVEIDKDIKSLFHNEKYIGLVLKNEGKEGYELRLYNTNGKVVMSEDFTGDYSNVKISGSQVIMYDGKKCSIFLRSGVQKFDGNMDDKILEIVPIAGVNKYIVINANGMEKIRLVK
jgi:hypothetical protein